MCGICGFTGENTALLRSMLKVLGHRGPDDKGSYSNGKVSLGHLRLAIIDLSRAGRQPMTNKEQTVWIVFNGEIYNYKAVRADLQQLGKKFATETDTEVIIRAYETWGVDCLQRFNGMFAFCIYDSKKQQFFLARDRFGQKPLYYAHTAKGFSFASEIKALLKERDYTLNKAIVPYLLTYRYIPSTVPVFTGIEKLEAGHYLIYDLKQKTIVAHKCYWQLQYEPKHNYSTVEAMRLLREKMEQAVAHTLVADVPVGAFLSGGIDSSIATYHAAKLHPHIKTFSIGSTDAAHDESRYAEIVSKEYNTEHQTIFIEQQQFLKQMQSMYTHYDTPFLSSSSVTLYFLAKEARKKVTVAISGEGGDENFAGYTRYRWFDRISKIPGPARPLVHLGGKTLAALKPHTKAKIAAALKSLSMSEPQRYAHLANYADEELLQALVGHVNEQKLFEQYDQYFTCKDRIDNALNADMHIYMESDLLLKLDTSTMAHALEGRVPFLDHELASWVAQLPASSKLHGKQQKYLLKEAYSKILPKQILERKKMGFGLPFHEFMGKDGKGVILNALGNDAALFREKLVKRDTAQKLIAAFDTNGTHQEEVYTLFQLEQFMAALPEKMR
jgi:asparagine synthase (glutamine-hydrolysing)